MGGMSNLVVDALGERVSAQVESVSNLLVIGFESSLTAEAIANELKQLLKQGGIVLVPTGNETWSVAWCLLFWDCIFSRNECGYDPNLSRDFPSELQDIPRDLFSPDFYFNRKDQIESRLDELENSSASKMLAKVARSHAKKKTRLLDGIENLDLRVLGELLDGLPRPSLRKIFSRLSRDFNETRSGFPAWVALSDVVTFVDVRSPKGSLRANQIDWLRFLSGGCGVDCIVVGGDWSERKVKSVATKMAGPKGVARISYGKSSSKHFQEVEALVEDWGNVTRGGAGSSLKVTAELPMNRIGEALPVIEKIVRWKSAEAAINGVVVEMKSGSPLRCVAAKENEWQGSDYCVRQDWLGGGRSKLGCKLFSHPALMGNLDGYGAVSSDGMSFVVAKDRVEAEVLEQLESLALCPYFARKKIERELERLPESIQPETMKNYGWVSSSGQVWIYERGNWIDGWGGELPNRRELSHVRLLTTDERRDLAKRNRETLKFEKEAEQFLEPVRSNSPSKKKKTSGCTCLTLILGALVLWVLASVVSAL